MSKFKDIDILQYIKLNYLSKNVIHEGKGKIVPFHGAHVELGENSKLIMHDGSLEIGTNKVKGSKAETLIRLRKDAIWNVNGYCGLSYGVTVEVNDYAEFNTRRFVVESFEEAMASDLVKVSVKSVKDMTQTDLDTLNKTDDLYVLITDETGQVSFPGKVLYVSDGVESVSNKQINVTDNMDGLAYIVYENK